MSGTDFAAKRNGRLRATEGESKSVDESSIWLLGSDRQNLQFESGKCLCEGENNGERAFFNIFRDASVRLRHILHGKRPLLATKRFFRHPFRAFPVGDNCERTERVRSGGVRLLFFACGDLPRSQKKTGGTNVPIVPSSRLYCMSSDPVRRNFSENTICLRI